MSFLRSTDISISLPVLSWEKQNSKKILFTYILLVNQIGNENSYKLKVAQLIS